MQADVLGFLLLPVVLNCVTKVIKFFIILKCPFILGVNFWRIFYLAPHLRSALPFTDDCGSPFVSEVNHVHHLEDLIPTQRQKADKVVHKYEEVSLERAGLGRKSHLAHSIVTEDTPPIKQRYHCISPDRLKN